MLSLRLFQMSTGTPWNHNTGLSQTENDHFIKQNSQWTQAVARPLWSVHWLPVSVIVTCFSPRGQTPCRFFNHITDFSPITVRRLRNSNKNHGDATCFNSSPKLCNTFPQDIREHFSVTARNRSFSLCFQLPPFFFLTSNVFPPSSPLLKISSYYQARI